MTAQLTEQELAKMREWEPKFSWEASDQRQYEAEMQAAKTEYERAMRDAAKSEGVCKNCGRQVDVEGLC